jgi:DUF4097 and DUF4098 domain-containing protein YvlB
MRVIVKLLLVIFVLGLVMTIAAFFMGLNIQGLTEFFNDDESYGEEIVYVQNDMIDGINLSSETRNVTLSVTDETFMTVRYYAQEKDTWTILEADGVLSILQEEKSQFFKLFNFKIASSEVRTINIEIPDTWILDLTIKSNVGTIRIEFDQIMNHKDLSVDSNTGQVYLKNINLDTVSVDQDTGSTSLTNVTIAGDLSVNTDTGKINLDNVTALDIDVNSNTGNIEMVDIEATNIIANNDTGRIISNKVQISGDLVYKTTTGKITLEETSASSYDLRASTGDIIITLESLSNMKLDLKATIGKIEIDGVNQGNTHVVATGTISMIVRVTTGNITINVQD